MNKKKVIRNVVIVVCVLAFMVTMHLLGVGGVIIEFIKQMHGIK